MPPTICPGAHEPSEREKVEAGACPKWAPFNWDAVKELKVVTIFGKPYYLLYIYINIYPLW